MGVPFPLSLDARWRRRGEGIFDAVRFHGRGVRVYRSDMQISRLTVAFFGLASMGLAQTPAPALHLVPMPRTVTARADVPLAQGVSIVCAGCDADDSFAANDLRQTLADRHIGTGGGVRIVLQRLAQHPDAAWTDAMREEGYTIAWTPGTLTLTGATAEGVFYAAQTVKQMIEPDGRGGDMLHAADVRDWPAMRYRGLHDDLSRGPVDTLEFQKKLVRTLAEYKVNLYSPYFESTQQYPSDPLAAVPGASMSVQDARDLVAYARQYHVVVVPEQEAFGHLRHMLTWEKFADLAETPHGAVLAPGQPGSLTLIDSMFKDLAALYPGPFLHIGGDETFELGMGRTRPEVDKRGLGAVYLDFMEQIVAELAPLHRKILFWGDIAQKAPELLKAAPQSFKDNTIVVAWGYWPMPSFGNYLKPFADSGFQYWVAPSINNYRQIWPNQQQALEDIQGFTRDGQKMGANGQLNTLWNDDGESLANENWYGILFGAACAWQSGESSIPQFEQSYGAVFHGDTTGLIDNAQQELTDAMTLLRENKLSVSGDGSDGLFWMDPWSKDGQQTAAAMRPVATPLRMHAEKAIELVARARLMNPQLREQDALDAMDFAARRLDFVGLMFQLSDEMIHGFAQIQATAAGPDWRHAKPGVASMFSDINSVNGRLQDLTYGYSQLRDMYQQQWLRSYRPANLRPVLERFDYTIALWLSRIDKVHTLQKEWGRDHAFDPAAVTALGIPAPLEPVAPSPVDVAPKP
jgi:hypothetical protein